VAVRMAAMDILMRNRRQATREAQAWPSASHPSPLTGDFAN